MSLLARRLGWELRLQWRYGILLAALFVTAVWAVILVLLPPDWRARLLPLVIFLDVAVFGVFFMPGLFWLERSDRALWALASSPLGAMRQVLARAIGLGLVSLAIASALGLVFLGPALGGAPFAWPALWLGSAIVVGVNLLAGFLAASRFRSINEYLLPSGLILLVFQLPALAYLAGAGGGALGALAYAVPTQGGMLLLAFAFGQAEIAPWQGAYALAYGGLAIALGLRLAPAAYRRFLVGGGAGRPARRGRRDEGREGARAEAPGLRRRRPIAALLAADARLVGRDAMMLFLAIYFFVLILAVRYLVPWIERRFLDGFDLAPYYPLIVSFFGLLLVPAMLGAIVGLMLLDERDEGTLPALHATPLGLRRYAAYRVLMPMLFGVIYVYLGIALTGLVTMPWLAFLPVALMTALEAPLVAFLLASLAGNKVEGLAYIKGLNLLFFVPVVAWFVPFPWRWLFGIAPTYWPAQATWWMAEGRFDAALGLVVAIGLAYHALLLRAVWRRFRARL